MILLSRSIVHPWLCDMMGHLTTRHYMAMFDDASYVLLSEATGWSPNDPEWAGLGWADVHQEIDYKDELSAGTIVEITGGVKRIGSSSIEIRLEMRRMNGKSLCAVMVAKTVFFDLSLRKARPFTESMRARAETLLVETGKA
ncbi:4-hydroxybenzoyl-CoA thioesterase [Mesorhizobium sp. L-8-10]|uniref:acyl-CoA thioesterase n=1 Tax=Mesorhizobium sp. L-8-10 TaxID=2744523 RepID=UPI0019277136|nr:acyl-CoA thioesterase [Mesorhizobium sp. L-8-10]BCH30169.1 4-hydroxybenzoyl-CoA thioesterase [Mesorhizobium sp. L-8-10]